MKKLSTLKISCVLISILLIVVEVFAQTNPNDDLTVEPGIIFGTDDRVPALSPAVARIMPLGCTGWMISNGAFLTAGHCAKDKVTGSCKRLSFKEVQFNVPLSKSNGDKNPPSNTKQDQYPINAAFTQCKNLSKSGKYKLDWAIFSVDANAKGTFPGQNQDAFFRVSNQIFPTESDNPPASLLRVTGYGIDGPPPGYGRGKGAPRNKYNQTLQTAVGKYVRRGVDSVSKVVNEYYLVDTMGGNSGSPVILNGTSLTIGIHSGAPRSHKSNWATSFKNKDLADAIQGFPGTLVSPVIDAANVFYIDNGSPQFASAPTGNIFAPFHSFTEALPIIKTKTSPILISMVKGSYPETIDQKTSVINDITLDLAGDVTLDIPVGDVSIWESANQPS